MKERLKNVVKWFFIILGILFLIQLLILSGFVIGFSKVNNTKISTNNFNLKEVEPIIEYAKEYKMQNGKFPKIIENVKLKKNIKYEYSTTNEDNCFLIKIEDKNITKQYEYCSIAKDGINSQSENYSEIKN